MSAWIATAKALTIGHSRKVQCCSTDPSAHVSNNHKGVSFFCHRCGRKEFHFHGPRSIKEIMATRVAEDAIRLAPSIAMPKDAVPLDEGPQEAWQWVLRGGLTPEDATGLYGLKWHEKTRRVLIPIGPADRLTALCGRAVFGERPKYRMLAGKADSFFRSPHKDVQCTVVVEDVLSAIAVGRAGANGIAVLGTAITAEHAAAIATGTSTVVGWFDPDKAGNTAWQRLRSRMALYPVNLHRITSTEDPKALHRHVLRGLLEPYLGA
jgi:hypothetical protein